MIIDSKGYWIGIDAKEHHSLDPLLCRYLTNYLKSHSYSVLDLGCGTGEYIKSFIDHGIKAIGCDGNPDTPTISNGLCSVCDLSTPINFNEFFDVVLSLEVAEHIPPEYEEIFINNIIKHTKNMVIISWAHEKQGGEGHFNERNESYVVSLFESRGFTYDRKESMIIRQYATLKWFRKNLYVFKL